MKEYGYAAHKQDSNGEWWDLGAGWASYEEAKEELSSQGIDDCIIYRAVTEDCWNNWSPVD